jgi:hypothetical protein
LDWQQLAFVANVGCKPKDFWLVSASPYIISVKNDRNFDLHISYDGTAIETGIAKGAQQRIVD